ncbi:FAD-binding oxidoreductase [soil metagenome]
MLVKENQDEFQNYLTDASNLSGGFADKLYLPETKAEIAEILKQANEKRIAVTISGARTGTVGGAIPFGGYIISLEKFNKIREINKIDNFAIVESGVILNDFQNAVDAENLFYPPDPTEWSCQIGGTIATNASGARSFKYGATRNFVKRLEIVLPNGDFLNLKRGEVFSKDGFIELETEQGNSLKAKLPTYQKPATRKNTSGYFSGETVDAIDLFIGSEGTLGIITAAELVVLPKPESAFSGIIFFENEENLLKFVNEVKEKSLQNRETENHRLKTQDQKSIDASLIEYFDEEALKFISEKFPEVPPNAIGAIFFEQEMTSDTEDPLLEQWNELIEKNHADLERSWFTTNEQDLEKMREFRHALPVSVNEKIVRYKQKKIGTDMAVPDENFASFLRFYKEKLNESGLEYVIFGHIGDNHLHANMIPKNEAEATKARQLYGRFIAQSIMLGGTISAEHGIGKLKKHYLYVMFGERYLNEMVEVKKAFDPHRILSRLNLFDEKFLS